MCACSHTLTQALAVCVRARVCACVGSHYVVLSGLKFIQDQADQKFR